MADNQQRRTDGHGHEVHERATDKDVVAKAGNFIERYKVFWFILVALVSWWTNKILIPLEESAKTTAEVRMVNVKIDSVIVPRLDLADKDRSQMTRVMEAQSQILGVLTRLQCLRTTAVDRAKIDLNCRDIPIDIPSLKPASGL